MNQFLNPVFLLKIAKSYLSDVNRVWKINFKEFEKYKDKSLRNIVKYSYNVPLYKKKYKESGIHPSDIKGIKDIGKLPIITKNDLRENYPNGIVPLNYNKKNDFLLSTSGSTGKPVFVYCDMFSAIKRLAGFARILKAYGGSWQSSKLIMIIDLSPGSVEHATYLESAVPLLKKFISLKNIKYLSIGEKPENLIAEINKFQPEFFGSDPNMLRKLATLRNNGFGKKIKPKYVFSGGSMLDTYTKKYVEKAFDAEVLDVYGSTEAGPMAFQCIHENNFHVHSDFVHMEFLDSNEEPVDFNKPGNLVITRLYGKGTPIIRYSGIEDVIIPIENKYSCGITTEMIKKIEGRSVDLILLPDGKTLSPLSITGIPAKIMEDYNTYKIKQFQIIQHTLREIEILIVIDTKLRNVGIPVEKLLKELQMRFSQKIGESVKVIVNETDEIQKDIRSDYVKVVISKVKKKK